MSRLNEGQQTGAIKRNSESTGHLAKQRPTHSKACRVHGLGDGAHSYIQAKCSPNNSNKAMHDCPA